MIVRKLDIRPRTLISIGMMFLASAGLWDLFVKHFVHLSEGVIDFLHGILLALAIGTLILALNVHRLSKRCAVNDK